MTKKIAIIPLPKHNTPTQGDFNNLNGYWTPPPFVIEHWAGACKVIYYNDETFQDIIKITHDSYNLCMSIFYKENVL